MKLLNDAGVETPPSRVHISERAQVVMPYHVLLDGLEEEARGKNAQGTTKTRHWALLYGQGGARGAAHWRSYGCGAPARVLAPHFGG